MGRAPLLAALLPFMAGIVITLFFPVTPLPMATAAATALTVMALTTFVQKLHTAPARLFQAMMALFFLSMGAVTALLRDPLANRQHYVHHTPVDTIVPMRLQIADSPVERTRSYRVKAMVLQSGADNANVRMKGNVMLYLQKDSLAATLRYGDIIEADGRLTLPQEAQNPYQFDYRRYLRLQGIARQCRLDSGDYRYCGHAGHGVTAWSKTVQRRLTEHIRRSGLSPSQQGVAEALLTGWRYDLDEESRMRFRDAGIMHLLCVSGLHVGIVAALVGLVCTPLRRRWGRVTKGVLQLGAIWIFVFITGMAPATLRAGIMFTLLSVAQLTGRQYNSCNTLAASALMMLCARPMLVADAGFQLSYAATFGIAVLYRPLRDLLPLHVRPGQPWYKVLSRRLGQRMWQLTCLSTAAQTATLPLTLYHFHQFPTYFLIANLTVVPAAGVIIAMTMLLAVASPTSVPAGAATRVLQVGLSAVDAVTRWIQGLPMARIEHVYCDVVTAVLVAASVAALAVLLRRRDWRWGAALLFCIVASAAYMHHVNRAADKQQRWVAYAIYGHTAIELFDGRNSVLLVDNGLYADASKMDYISDNLLTQLRIRHRAVLPYSAEVEGPNLSVRHCHITFHSTHIQIVDPSIAVTLQTADPPKKRQRTDCLVISGNPHISLAGILRHYAPDMLVLSADNAAWRASCWQSEAKTLQLTCSDLRVAAATLML
ncbi:MAG: ComEC/Rec2-related protein [bacterium P3]|nr:MAG: ComEC/Rec2-related protein [bacterium P3]KWW40133.1 MAG: ComEC/Rec2-related protein [bacterium F083]